MRTLATAAAVLLLAFAGCGKQTHDPSDDAIDANATLSIDPPTKEIVIAPAMPGMVTFTATATYPDGTTRDVTSEVAFSIDGSYGSFTNATASIGVAGKAEVTAAWVYDVDAPPKAADAFVIARMSSIRVDPTLPANTPDLFNGPEDLAAAPTVVYPAVGVVVPRNLGDFEAHWTDAHGYDVFELSLHTEFVDIRTYVPGGNGLAAAGPMPTWAAFLADEWMAAVGDEKQLSFQVRGVNSAAPTVVGTTAPQLVKLSNEPMEGGLYYWAIYPSVNGAPRVSGIWRHDMAHPGQVAEEYMSTTTEGKCVACHALSRDGSKMAITYTGGNGASTIVDVATKAPLAPTTAWNFGAFTPDSKELVGSEDGVLTVRSATDMTAVMTVPTNGFATHPDISPDGLHIVYVQPTAPSSADWHFGGGQIMVIDYDQTTHTFGAPRTLVTTSDNNYYPSWSPDNAWILFNRSSDNAPGSGAYDNASASLWVVKADGSAPPLELVHANASLNLTNSWGRWAPFAQSLGPNFTSIMWITVSSKRDFGVRKRLTDNWPQIWMLPFSPGAAAAGQDPSSPAFRLPFQNLESKNHIAQWAERIVVTQ
ncbi:MAG: hypothetical protein NT062_18460 [Proteobacteria bacterium]|nr:hypothetical protein [Pseudomonadota bacterium]